MLANLRLVQTDQPCFETRVDRPDAPVRISCGAELRNQLGGALRRLYHMDAQEQMPAEFDALLRAMQNPDSDANA